MTDRSCGVFRRTYNGPHKPLWISSSLKRHFELLCIEEEEEEILNRILTAGGLFFPLKFIMDVLTLWCCVKSEVFQTDHLLHPDNQHGGFAMFGEQEPTWSDICQSDDVRDIWMDEIGIWLLLELFLTIWSVSVQHQSLRGPLSVSLVGCRSSIILECTCVTAMSSFTAASADEAFNVLSAYTQS